MQKIISILFKILRRCINPISNGIIHVYCLILFYINNIHFKSFKTKGVPFVSIANSGKFLINEGFIMNNGLKANPIGRAQKCVFFVGRDATLSIGKNVGISAAALIAHINITISDNVKIGGGVCIYDTDFHSLNALLRTHVEADFGNKVSKPVWIKKNAFIGAHSTILKGVTIGENSVIGACSVVTKSIPDNEIWAGNPARFIKKIDSN